LLTLVSVSAILHTWSRCLSLAGLYSRAEFALKAAATPSLFSKGQLAACSLGASDYSLLISEVVFGNSVLSTPKSSAGHSRPSSTPALHAASIPRPSSRSGQTAGAGSCMRRPLSGGMKAVCFNDNVHISDASATNVYDGAAAVETGARFDAESRDGLQRLMLQEDGDDIGDDITFHNHQAPAVHPEYTSWIDVALGAAGKTSLFLQRSFGSSHTCLTPGVRPTPSALMAFAQGCALSVLCKVRLALRARTCRNSNDAIGVQDHIVAHASAAALSLTWISSSKRLHESVARRPVTASQTVAGALALTESLLNTLDSDADTYRPKTSYTVIKPGSPAQVRYCQM
jgi:hypothetical protein